MRKKWGYVSNDGRGGCDSVDPIKGGTKEFLRLNDLVKATFPKWGSQFRPEKGDCYETDLEMACGNLMNKFLRDREYKKILKRVSYIKLGEKGIFQLPTKYKPTPEVLKAVKATKWWDDKTYTMLNDLPQGEAFGLIALNDH